MIIFSCESTFKDLLVKTYQRISKNILYKNYNLSSSSIVYKKILQNFCNVLKVDLPYLFKCKGYADNIETYNRIKGEKDIIPYSNNIIKFRTLIVFINS